MGLANAQSKREDLLLDLAKEVAAATARLAKSSKDVAKSVSPDVDPKALIDDVTSCVLSTSDMIAVAKLLAPNIEDKQSKDLMLEAVKNFERKLVTCVENGSRVGTDREATQRMEAAGRNVGRTLNSLKSVLREDEDNNINEILHDILKNFNTLTTNKNYDETIERVKDLKKALKKEIEGQEDPQYKNYLQGLVDQISLATTRVLEATKASASDPNKGQEEVIAALTELTAIAQDAVNVVNRRKLFHQLEVVAMNAASEATSCVEATKATSQDRLSNSVKAELAKVCTRLTEPTASLSRAVKLSRDNPVSARAQTNLLERAEEFSLSARELITKNKSSTLMTEDTEAGRKLQSSTSNFEQSLNELVQQIKRTEKAAESVRCEATKELLESLDPELIEMETILNSFDHRPVNSEYLNDHVSDVASSANAVQDDILQISRALDSGDLTQIQEVIGNLGHDVSSLIQSVKEVAGTSEEVEEAKQLITTAQDLLLAARSYVETLTRLRSSGTVDNNSKSEVKTRADTLSRETVRIKKFSRMCSSAENGPDLDHLPHSIEEYLQNFNNQNFEEVYENLLKAEQTLQDELKKMKITNQSEHLKEELTNFSNTLSQKRKQLEDLAASESSREALEAPVKEFAIELSEVTDYLTRLKAFKRLAGKTEKTILASDHCNDLLVDIPELETAVTGLQQTVSQVSESLKQFQEKPASGLAKANLLTEVTDLLSAGQALVIRSREHLGQEDEEQSRSVDRLAKLLLSLANDKKKAEEAGQLEIEAAEELLESLTEEFENFKTTSQELGMETGDGDEAGMIESTVEMNKDLGIFISSALENNKKNMNKGVIKIGKNMEHFVRSATVATAKLDNDDSEKREALVNSTKDAIQNAKDLLTIAKV